jgi:hypothetical protein
MRAIMAAKMPRVNQEIRFKFGESKWVNRFLSGKVIAKYPIMTKTNPIKVLGFQLQAVSQNELLHPAINYFPSQKKILLKLTLSLPVSQKH